MEPLQLEYRPQTWDDVEGEKNRRMVNNLKGVLKQGGARVFLLSGPPGCGKTSIARLIAKEVGCSLSQFYELNTGNLRGIDIKQSPRTIGNKQRTSPKLSVY